MFCTHIETHREAIKLILQVTWNATSDAATWVVLNDDTGQVMGAVQLEGHPPDQPNSPRRYEIFGSQTGVPPDSGTVEAGMLDEHQVLELWTKHQAPHAPAEQQEEQGDGTRSVG